MRSSKLLILVGLLTLGACNNAQRVERPMEEVYATLTSMPAEANAMSLATTFPGTDSYLQPDGGRLIWHFRHNGQDYGRFIATIAKDGPEATKVSTAFEEASDASIAGKLDFLRDIALIAGEASVAAALAGRAVDRVAIEQQIRSKIAADPMAAQIATIDTVGAEIDRYVQEEKEREARDAPAYLKPGVYPQVGGSGGPRAEPDRR